MDKRFGWQTRGDTCLADLYRLAGKKLDYPFSFTPSYSITGGEPEIAYGHKKVREAIQLMDDGEPGIIIQDHCKHMWDSVTHYIRKRRTGKSADDHAGADGQIVQKHKDMSDALRYGLCSFIKPAPLHTPKNEHDPEYEDYMQERDNYWNRPGR